MNWQELTGGLELEWRRLEGVELTETFVVSLQTKRDLVELVCQRESSTRAVLDAAVRAFSHGWSWPELSDDEKYFLKVRLHYAWRLADSFVRVETRQPPKAFLPGHASENMRNMLEWLLIDLWPSLSFPIWLETRIQYYVGRSGDELTTEPVLRS